MSTVLTVLLIAAAKIKSSEQRVEMIKMLLSHGADVHHRNKKGMTALDYCWKSMKLKTLEADVKVLVLIRQKESETIDEE